MTGAALLRGAAGAATVDRWRTAIDAHPAWRERRPGADFNPQASSLRLRAVAALDPEVLARTLLGGAVGAWCRSLLGDQLACAVDQCWVRRQYAPARRPAGHATHAWHQDGALGHDFLRPGVPAADALLEMVTCWIALTPCGRDAPGLELERGGVGRLLTLPSLGQTAARLDQDAGAAWRPELEPGDALLFDGGVVHRTDARPEMSRDRTSVELRFFAAADRPARLVGDRFVVLH